MKKTIAIISSLVICVSAFAQATRNNLLFNMSEDAATSSISAVTLGDSLFTIVGATGVSGNIGTMMPGLVSGLRGLGYITIVDGVERSAGYLRPEEIESVTVLKDAAALAAYGLRSANGVMVVKTKRGYDGPVRITADYHFTGNTPFRQPEMASPMEYCLAVNEARRNDGLGALYSLSDINALADGTSIFPNNDWRKLLSRDFSSTHNVTLTAEGLEKGVRFFVLANYEGSVGHLANTNYNDGYTTQSLGSALSIRSNFEVMITKTTQLAAHINASLSQNQSGSDNYGAVFSTPSFMSPIKAEDGTWVTSQNFGNPFRDQVGGGYGVNIDRRFTADISLNQDLSSWTPGLSASLLLSYDVFGGMNDSHGVSNYYYLITYDIQPDAITENYTYQRFGNNTGNTYSGGNQYEFSNRYNGWLSVKYDRSFGKHDVNATLVYDMNHYKGLGSTNVAAYMDGILHGHYAYDKRYVLDFTGTLSNSGKVKKVFFLPAVSAAWVASNEKFLKNVEWLDLLKIKASWGKTAYDSALNYDMDKRYNNLNNGGSYIFMRTTYQYGSRQGALPCVDVVPEIDTKYNVGIEFAALHGLTFSAEGYMNTRENLQGYAGGEYSSVIGVDYPTIFTGHETRWGADLAIGYNGQSKNWKYNANLTVNYTDGRYDHVSEEFNPNSYQYRSGTRMGCMYMYESDGFYTKDDFNEDGSLKPGVVGSSLVASLQPGDVKYKDKNGDGTIDNQDKAYLSKYNSMNKWNYGLNLGFQYKGFGVQALFQAKTGFYVNTSLSSIYQPLVDNNRNISKHYLQNYWYEGNESNARYPRLTTVPNSHNFADSDIWYERGDFLKLRTLYVFYDFSGSWMGRMKGLRVYARGHNLFSIDNIRIFDPENISGGYPSTRAFEIGAKFTF